MIDMLSAQNIFNSLYDDINGYDVSHEARRQAGSDTSEFLYGELPFLTWIKIVRKTKPKDGAVFFDLGSGTGRLSILSYLLFDFKKIIGVEILAGLHNKACEVRDIFDEKFRPQIADSLKGREIKLINENLFDTDLREADFVIVNYPFKDGSEFNRLEEKLLNELKPGTKITTIIRSLKNPRFKRLGSQSYKFSWGRSDAHFFEV